MTSQTKMTMEWAAEQYAQEKAGKKADALVLRLGLAGPIDPLQIARGESPLLRVGGRDLRNRFDGKLSYDKGKRCFLLMYNTKYDIGRPEGKHHPRTRFSISHELGHYFLDHHHSYLAHDGKPHPSLNEFRSLASIEREADAFAASLLLPTHLVRPRVNTCELSLDRIGRIATDFETSHVSTAIRSVRLSHFPCAVAGVRDGQVKWMFPSESLIKGGIYPKRGKLPPNAVEPWSEFGSGSDERTTSDGLADDWFSIYRDNPDRLYLTEEYFPVHSLGTLLVLLTLDEQDVFPEEDDEQEDDDD